MNELTIEQGVMHYSRHHLTALVTYVTTRSHTCQPACLLVSSSKTKPCQFSSVHSVKMSLCTRLKNSQQSLPTLLQYCTLWQAIEMLLNSYHFCNGTPRSHNDWI